MRDLLNTQLLQEINGIIKCHLETLKRYGVWGSIFVDSAANPVMTTIETLTSLMRGCAASEASLEQYRDVDCTRQAIEAFLKAMNQDLNVPFSCTELGKIYTEAQNWCRIAKRNFRPPIDRVWDFIQPAVPDCLTENDDGDSYTAKWWTPVPTTDIEILHHASKIAIRDEYVDATHPGLACIQFSLIPMAL